MLTTARFWGRRQILPFQSLRGRLSPNLYLVLGCSSAARAGSDAPHLSRDSLRACWDARSVPVPAATMATAAAVARVMRLASWNGPTPTRSRSRNEAHASNLEAECRRRARADEPRGLRC